MSHAIFAHFPMKFPKASQIAFRKFFTAFREPVFRVVPQHLNNTVGKHTYTAGGISDMWRLGASLTIAAGLVFTVSACMPLRPVTYDPAPIVCGQTKSLHEGRIGFLNASENFSLASQAGVFLDEEFPGPFVWDRIQSSFGAPYAFSEPDAIVQRAQVYGFSLTGILWPYAEWDQKSYGLGTTCQGGGYSQSLPPHRCRPDDDDAYS